MTEPTAEAAIDHLAGLVAPKMVDGEVVLRKEALIRLYMAINHPVQAGPKWVTYSRGTTDAMLEVLRQFMLLPAERECCGTFPGSQHRSTCEHNKEK